MAPREGARREFERRKPRSERPRGGRASCTHGARTRATVPLDQMPLRVVLVDDHHLFRAGVRAAISLHADLEVVGEASDARSALSVVETARPDVVVLDVSLPGSDGIAVTKDVMRGRSRIRVLILTMHKGPDFVRQALAAGAAGYAFKDEPPESVIEAIRTVGAGDLYLSPSISRVAVDPGGKPDSEDLLGRLSAREREIFSLIVHGHRSQEIATELCISIKTVETHRSHINQKLGVHSTGEIVRLAALRGLLPQ